MTAVAYPVRPGLQLAVKVPRPLITWIAAEIGLATVVMVVVVAAVPLRREIALPWPGLPPIVALAAGLCFWLALGLLGGSQSRSHPGGAVMTFNVPFIVGGTILGGPLAGALLGLVAELELRELRAVEWYGVLSNHAVSILCAVTAGFVGEVLRGPIGAILPDQPALALFVVSGAMAVAYTSLNVLLVIPVLALRGGMTVGEAGRIYDPAFRDRSMVEGLLAWLLAATYVTIGWWATVASAALVAVAWRAHESAYALEHDPMTGLLNDRGLAPRLDAAIELAKAGRRLSAYLALDLDKLWEVNQRHGSAAGDQLLRAVAARMNAAVRASDSVSRKASTGDEFVILLDRIPDLESALHVAARIQAAIRQSVQLRGQIGRVELVPDISIGLVVIERGTDMTASDVRDLAEQRLEASKCRKARIVSAGNGPTQSEKQRRALEKALTRQSATRGDAVRTARVHRRRRTDQPGDGLQPDPGSLPAERGSTLD
jgi:diguanylate cyclase (GGDEF)-like protein